MYDDIEGITRELRRDTEAKDFARADGIAKTLSSLETELALVQATSTWPWRTSTLRSFLSAVLLPLFLWATHEIIARYWMRSVG